MKKLFYLMIVSVLLSSCSLIISDEDGDGISNGSRFITKVYENRKIRSFHSLEFYNGMWEMKKSN